MIPKNIFVRSSSEQLAITILTPDDANFKLSFRKKLSLDNAHAKVDFHNTEFSSKRVQL